MAVIIFIPLYKALNCSRLSARSIAGCLYFVILNNADEAISEIQKIDKIKSKLDIMIDGMVLKVNNIPVRDEIGYTAKFPK